MDKRKWLGVLLLNFAIALGFYIDNLSTTALNISSDLANIIPVCKKIDNPDWYQNDLYLSDIKDVEYYTPFFVETLRFLAQFTQSDYIQALNVLGFITHFSYGILWFLLFFTIKKEYWLALFMSLLIRGVIWPPGGELLGISEIWTIMPRTVYLALLPLPFLCFMHLKKYKFIIGGILLGLILNFHPLSGLGGILGYFVVFVSYHYFHKTLFKNKTYWELIQWLGACVIGMLPYVYVYLSNVDATVAIDPKLFQLAFDKRIPKHFGDPVEFIKLWHRPSFYFFLSLFLLFCCFDASKNKRNSKIITVSVVLIFIVSNGSVYLERMINVIFDTNLRMSFQLIRFQKFILVFFQIGTYLLLAEMIFRLKPTSMMKRSAFFLFFGLLLIADMPFLKKVPFVSDDICNQILPYTLKFRKKPLDADLVLRNNMVEYIKNNTPSNAVFYGDFYLRAAANRSVQLDGKGASMLIEGDLNKFTQWYVDKTKFEGLSIENKIEFLRSIHVNYIMDSQTWDNLEIIHKEGNYNLYKL